MHVTGFDLERLKIQPSMLPDMFNTNSFSTMKKVTNVRTIASAMNAMNESAIYKGMLPEVDKLLRLYLIFSATTFTAECSFSFLQRIKTYLRSTMTSSIICSCCSYVHQDITHSLDLCKIAREFMSVNT